MALLRQMAEHCDYKETLLDMLRDRSVCGVNHQGMQCRLLAEKDLTYKKAIELAKSMDAAEKGSQAISSDIKQTATTPPIDHVDRIKSSSRRRHGAVSCVIDVATTIIPLTHVVLKLVNVTNVKKDISLRFATLVHQIIKVKLGMDPDNPVHTSLVQTRRKQSLKKTTHTRSLQQRTVNLNQS